MIMPAPNIKPPMMLPDRLPRAASCRASPTSSRPAAIASWVAATAAEKVSSQIATLVPNWPCENSITAARRQNLLRCAQAPNAKPTSRPPAVSTAVSPNRSMSASKFKGVPLSRARRSERLGSGAI